MSRPDKKDPGYARRARLKRRAAAKKICDFCGEPIAGGLQEHDFAACAHNLKDKVAQLEARIEYLEASRERADKALGGES